MPDERCRVLRRRLARRAARARTLALKERDLGGAAAPAVERPPFADLFGVTGRRWLAEVQLPLEERESVDAGLRQIAFLDAEIKARRAADRPAGVGLAGDPPVDDRAGREPDLRRDVHRRDRRATGSYAAQARRVPRAGSEGPPVRRGPARSGRISKRGSASARWALVEAAWSAVKQPGRCTRSTSAPARASARQGDRRDRPQARDPVLVHAHAQRTTPTSSPR